MNQVKIKLDERGAGSVEVDGVNEANLTIATQIDAGAGRPTTITFTRTCSLLEFEGAADVRVVNVCAGCRRELAENEARIDGDSAARALVAFLHPSRQWDTLPEEFKNHWRKAAAVANLASVERYRPK